MRRRAAGMLLALLPALGACGSDSGSAGDDEPRWLASRPALANRSLWSQSVDMAAPPPPPALGVIGVGNGRVYGNVGNQYPLAAWHNLGGPTYQKSFKWFSDKVPELLFGGRAVEATQQSIERVRNSAVVITAASNAELEWTSVNFAPLYPDDPRAEQALLSVWIVRNTGRAPVSDVALRVTSIFGTHRDGALVESDWEDRTLTLRPLGGTAGPGASPRELLLPVGELAPGAERTVELALVFTSEGEDPAQILAVLEAVGVDALLDSTLESWNAWAADITTVRTPDPKFDDLLRGLAVSIRVNQAVTGGVSQMTQYSNTWLRDIHGPALYLPLIGLLDDYEDMLDYQWGAALVTGGLANAYSLDFDAASPPPQPDWESMGVMSGRTRAEGPSLLILEYERYYEATGDLTPIRERWGMLEHALLKQGYVDGCLLPFSSDETFEDLMQMAFGENVLIEPDESTLSLYSSLLAIRASRFLAEAAERLGRDDAAVFSGKADAITACLEDTFWMDDPGRYAVKVRTDTREPWAQPYEDISTMPIWLDALPIDSPRVIGNFESTLEALGHDDGLLYSPIPPPYSLLFPDIETGALTGMSHGYWLNNLDKMFHPMADVAFARWRDVFSKTGFTDEAVVADDFSHLALLREPFGFVSDVSSRFRSWEPGVMGFALLHHLTGYDPSVPAGRVGLAPHLPEEWDRMSFDGLAFGAGRIDLEVERVGSRGRRIVVSADERSAFELDLKVPLDGVVERVSLDGRALDPALYEARTNRYGRTVVELAPIEIAPGQRAEIAISVTD